MSKQLEDKSAADVLEAVGRALFEFEYEEPSQWPSRLARALGVTPVSLRNWRRGRAPFDAGHGALDDLLRIAERRAEEVTRARDELKSWLRRNRREEEKPE